MSTKAEDTDPADPTVANRFLSHQLSDAERVVFEAQLLVNADLVKELEATARFKVGLQKLRETGALDALIQPKRRFNSYIVAAAAAVMIGIGIVAIEVSRNPTALLAASVEQLTRPGGKVLGASAPYVLIRKRAAAARIPIELPAGRQAIQLRLFPALTAEPPLRVSITAVGGKLLAATIVEGIDDDRFVTIFVDSELLPAGEYLVTVAPIGGQEALSESYPIEVRGTVQPTDHLR